MLYPQTIEHILRRPWVLLLSVLLLHLSNAALCQTIDVGPPDTSVCNGTPITLTAITTGVSGNPTFTALNLPTDDTHSQLLNIGFPFEFFGNTYTQCVASSNGYVTFNLGTASTPSPWSISSPSPTPGVPDNAIMFPWQDINPNAGTGGTNAADCGDGTFIVDYVDISMYSCTSLKFTMQVKLYQGSNIIDTYITSKPLCTSWNNGAAIHGLENANGTQSVIVPGRNFPTQWAATNDAVRFIPNGFGSYTIDQTIPFNPTPVGNESIKWTDGAGNVIGNQLSVTVTPATPTWYYCRYQSACSAITVVDSIFVTLGNVDITLDPTDASCFGFDDGSVRVDPTGSAFPVTIDLMDAGGATVQTINNVSGVDTLRQLIAGNYTVQVRDGVGCSASMQFTIDQPAPLVANATHTDILCSGDGNGTATAAPTGGTLPYAYTWNDPLQQTGSSIAHLPAGSYTLTVTDAKKCVFDTTLTVIEPLSLLLTLQSGADTCLYKNGAVRADVQGGTQPIHFGWSSLGGDSSNFAMDNTNYAWSTIRNLSTGTYTVVVKDANACTVEGSIKVPLITPPAASFHSRSKAEEFIDPEVQFVNESSMALSYEWYFGDGEVSYAENPKHVYDTSGVYLVMLIAYNDPQYGCADTSFKYIEVDPFFTFYVPNAFTPDGDGLNETWGPKGQSFEYESYNVQIFDRWGKLVWQTDNPLKNWDGSDQHSTKQVKQGMYIYVFKLKKFNTFEPKTITGTVSLYRNR